MKLWWAAVVTTVVCTVALVGQAAERTLVRPVFKDHPPEKKFLEVPELPPLKNPPQRADIERAIQRGVAFLLKRQNKDGSWGTPHRTKGLNIYAPPPGAHQAFRAAVTSLCVAALVETARDDPKALASLDRAEQWLFQHLPHVRRATGDAIYNVWAHGYSLQALSRLYRLRTDPKEKQKLLDLAQSQVEMLCRYESVDGGWGYYDFRYQTKKPSASSISFVNAAIWLDCTKLRTWA